MFKDIVKASRSYRGYDESYRFSREELEDFVDCARFAPSSVNAQPFRYYLAWENEEVDRIQKLTNLAPVLIVAFGKPAEKIVIKEIEEGENIAYYRDENDVHYVPKRKLEDIIIKK